MPKVTSTEHAPHPQSAPRKLLAVVAVAAVATNALCLAGSHLWVYPDSIDYIQLGAGLADRLDLANELFLIRTPGYPLFLAAIFRIFGSASPIAILLLQHAMAVATAALGAALAWHLSYRGSIALIAGLMCACSLQVLSYANLVLTETPYTLSLLACAYFLVRYMRQPAPRLLALASLMAGASYLLRPVGLHLIGACLAAAALALRTRRSQAPRRHPPRVTLRSALTHTAAAVCPAIVAVAPWTLTNSIKNGGVETARCLDYILYLRAVTFDGLDSSSSSAMQDIHKVVHEAKRRGIIAPDASHRDRGTVIKAYRTVRGATFAQCSAILGQAARDLMREHTWEIAVGTARYSMWMLLTPDPVYRFQPGGAPGINGKRNSSAGIYDIATYSRGPGSWEHVLVDYERYLPLQTEPRRASPVWTAICRAFHHRLDRADPILGVFDSPYEQFAALCGIGAFFSLWMRDRPVWIVIALIVAMQVGVSAALSGPQTRYALPIKPLMLIYFALFATTLINATARLGRSMTRPLRHTRNSSGSRATGTERTAPAGS